MKYISLLWTHRKRGELRGENIHTYPQVSRLNSYESGIKVRLKQDKFPPFPTPAIMDIDKEEKRRKGEMEKEERKVEKRRGKRKEGRKEETRWKYSRTRMFRFHWDLRILIVILKHYYNEVNYY